MSRVFHYLSVLLEQLGKVLKQGVLRPQKIELEVSLLPIHEVGEELPEIMNR